MIYLVHGENLSYSRNIILNQQKKLGTENKIEIDISDITPEQLAVMGNSTDIFGTSPFIVLDLSSAGRKNLDNYADVLKKIPQETTLILLAPKVLPAASPFIKRAVELGIKIILNEKKPTSNIFRFISVLFTANRTAVYKELHKLITEDQDPFYIFSMILYGIRKNHLKFRENRLKNIFEEMYKIDKAVKTGNISQEVFIPYTVEKLLEEQTHAL